MEGPLDKQRFESDPPGGWLGSFDFHQRPDTAEVFARHFRLRVETWDGLLVLVRRVPGFGVLRAMVGGPEARGVQIHDWAPLQKVSFSELVLRTNQPYAAAEPHRTSADDNRAYVLDLRLGPEHLFSNFRRNCRKSIRSVMKRGVQVEPSADPGALNATYAMCAVNAERQGFDIPTLDLVRDMMSVGAAQLLVARDESGILGGTVYLLAQGIWGWIGATVPGNRGRGIANFLHWGGMRWGSQNGYSFFDFGDQSAVEYPSIAAYKRSFSPMLLPAFSYTVPGSSWKRAARGLIRTVAHRGGRL